MKVLKNKKGYTLLELMIIFAIASIVLTPLTLLMMSSLKNSNVIQQNIDADQSTQQTFIIFNEAVRSNGVGDVDIIVDYHGNGEALRIGTHVFILKDNNYVKQTYDALSEDASSEAIVNAFVNQVDYMLTSESLEVNLHIDKDGDGTVEDIFPYKFSVRE